MRALELTDYRAAVARIYLDAADLKEFRARRDQLFATHPQSATPERERSAFTGLRYFPPNDDAICEAELRPAEVLSATRVRLDFNYLYNPSCAYDDAWLCPLAPPENQVDARIQAGELAYH